MSKKKISLPVVKWVNEPVCAKCLRTEGEQEDTYDAFHVIHLEDTKVLFMTCKACGYNWLMESADAT
jgi:predicted nucleic-acid-binding Zn-ribbon protein